MPLITCKGIVNAPSFLYVIVNHLIRDARGHKGYLKAGVGHIFQISYPIHLMTMGNFMFSKQINQGKFQLI